MDVRTSGHTLVSQIKNFEEFIFHILDPLGRFQLEKNRGCEPWVKKPQLTSKKSVYYFQRKGFLKVLQNVPNCIGYNMVSIAGGL